MLFSDKYGEEGFCCTGFILNEYMRGSTNQGCIFCLTCSHPELTEDHVLTSAYVKMFRTVTRNAVNKSVWRKKDYSWLPLNKHAMIIWLSSLRIRAHLIWRTGKHRHVLHVLRTYSTCSHPVWKDGTKIYATLVTLLSVLEDLRNSICRHWWKWLVVREVEQHSKFL